MKKGNEIIRWPVRATFTVDRTTGQIIEKSFEYADLPAVAVADFFFRRFGLDVEEVNAPDESRKNSIKKTVSTMGVETCCRSSSNPCRDRLS